MLLRRAAGEDNIQLGCCMGDDLSTPASLHDIELTSAKIFNDFRECPEVLDSVTVLFRENYRFDVSSLKSALTVGDSAKIAFLAHKMRGSILCFHQDGAARVASELEEKARQNDFGGIDRLIESLAQAYDLVCSSVERAKRMLVECEADQGSQLAG
jgi:HPt (histidine-containing phosphotransfer) domain-containing protein